MHHLLLKTVAGVAITATLTFAATAATITITQSGQHFNVSKLAVQAGDVIVFSNQDDVTHNIKVIDDDDEPVDLGLQTPGQVLTYKFDKAGRFRVRCSIHPSMRLSVNVN